MRAGHRSALRSPGPPLLPTSATLTQPAQQRLALGLQLLGEPLAHLAEQFGEGFGLRLPGLAVDTEQLAETLGADLQTVHVQSVGSGNEADGGLRGLAAALDP